jgi:hypothetical protein
MSRRPHRFTDLDIAQLERACEHNRGVIGTSLNAAILAEGRDFKAELARSVRTIQLVQYHRLKKELLEGVNPKINIDQHILISRMEELGFRRDIAEALAELERDLRGRQAAGLQDVHGPNPGNL